jgi:bifunctional non-homologous end joining protein LigD
MGLNEYRGKRRFDTTPEPHGGAAGERPEIAGPRFVVQEHDASRRHWDLRLEMEGVLRSWAVPKGPSLDPADKRLAVLVEDHPIEYGEFEGVIPPGNYGAGTVMLWDRGAYACREGDPAAAFRAGKLTLDCFGEKLRGEFHFVRTKRNAGRDWLLFKGKDRFAVSGYSPLGTRSVKSGRSIEEIAADGGERWQPAVPPEATNPGTPRRGDASKRGSAPKRGGRRKRGSANEDEGADPFPAPFEPMLAQTAGEPFDRSGWLFEVKWDGVRALACVQRRGAVQEVGLWSRTLRRLNAQFPEIVDALSRVDVRSVVLDGEIIAPDEAGRSSFARLQQRLHVDATSDGGAAGRIGVVYAVFDCLYLNGRDLRGAPLSERRQSLDALTLPQGLLRTDVVEGHGRALFEAAHGHGLEGIVGKRASSLYRPGVRSPEWQKVKVRATIEAVVGGFTRGKGQRSRTFGALVLGQYDPRSGRLVPIGQVGGGLTDADMRALRRRLEPLVTPVCPFASRPRPLAPPTWVRPELVVEVSYGGWTDEGMLRFPVFVRVRDDVRPRDVLTSRVPAEAAPPETDGEASAAAPGRRGRERRVPTRDGAAPVPAGLTLTNLDKVFFPGSGFTKGDVIDYYRRIAPHLLPHLRDRPLALRRFPDGIGGDDFFQKDVPDAPAFVRTARIWSDQGHRDIDAVVGADEATLLWLAQLGCIEMHAWFSRTTPVPGRERPRPTATFSGAEATLERSVLNYPDFVVFDIDPFIYPPGKGPERRHGELDPEYTRHGFEAAREAAVWVNEALGALGLRSFVKTSGKTGIHVFVPIARRYTYAQTHAFAKTLATWLTRHHPERLTTAWAVQERVGKVFLDYNQNVRGKTIASVYSLRPVPEATVSVPVTWDELRAGVDPLRWTIATVFDRLARVGDLWAGILSAPQHLDVGAASPPRKTPR